MTLITSGGINCNTRYEFRYIYSVRVGSCRIRRNTMSM